MACALPRCKCLEFCVERDDAAVPRANGDAEKCDFCQHERRSHGKKWRHFKLVGRLAEDTAWDDVVRTARILRDQTYQRMKVVQHSADNSAWLRLVEKANEQEGVVKSLEVARNSGGRLIYNEEKANMQPPTEDEKRLLDYAEHKHEEVFKATHFLSMQREVIASVLRGNDAIVVMPTGSGKSRCFQLPAIVCGRDQNGRQCKTTIVVSPLNALIDDQVATLRSLGVSVGRSHMGVAAEEREALYRGMRARENLPCLIYVTPEGLLNNGSKLWAAVKTLAEKDGVLRFVIDEAHCICDWGESFRETYSQLGKLRNDFPNVPILALTGTADIVIVRDIALKLRMKDVDVFLASVNRPNIRYDVRLRPNTRKGWYEELRRLIEKDHPGQSGIVYCARRKACEHLAAELVKHGVSVAAFHAGLDEKEKSRVLEGWKKGDIRVVIGTQAFGMGIDRADVRFVVHATLPRSIVVYMQESGRAGRDGEAARSIIYYRVGDVSALSDAVSDGGRMHIDTNDPTKVQITAQDTSFAKVMDALAYCQNERDCRRSILVRHFGEVFDPSECTGCNTCDGERALAVLDLTAIGREIARYVVAASGPSREPLLFSDVREVLGKWKGKKSHNDQRSEQHGLLAGMSEDDIDAVLSRLVHAGALSVSVRKTIAGRYLALQPGRCVGSLLGEGDGAAGDPQTDVRFLAFASEAFVERLGTVVRTVHRIEKDLGPCAEQPGWVWVRWEDAPAWGGDMRVPVDKLRKGAQADVRTVRREGHVTKAQAAKKRKTTATRGDDGEMRLDDLLPFKAPFPRPRTKAELTFDWARGVRPDAHLLLFNLYMHRLQKWREEKAATTPAKRKSQQAPQAPTRTLQKGTVVLGRRLPAQDYGQLELLVQWDGDDLLTQSPQWRKARELGDSVRNDAYAVFCANLRDPTKRDGHITDASIDLWSGVEQCLKRPPVPTARARAPHGGKRPREASSDSSDDPSEASPKRARSRSAPARRLSDFSLGTYLNERSEAIGLISRHIGTTGATKRQRGREFRPVLDIIGRRRSAANDDSDLAYLVVRKDGCETGYSLDWEKEFTLHGNLQHAHGLAERLETLSARDRRDAAGVVFVPIDWKGQQVLDVDACLRGLGFKEQAMPSLEVLRALCGEQYAELARADRARNALAAAQVAASANASHGEANSLLERTGCPDPAVTARASEGGKGAGNAVDLSGISGDYNAANGAADEPVDMEWVDADEFAEGGLF